MKEIYRKTSLFADAINDENMVDELDGYVLIQEDSSNTWFDYKVFDDFDTLVGKWLSKENCLSMQLSEYKKSNSRKLFVQVVKQELAEINKINQAKYKKSAKSIYDYDDDDRAKEAHRFAFTAAPYVYTPPKKSTGFLNTLNKSDTLVIHCKDRTTEMLGQIYEGKNWDVLRDGNIDKEELHILLDAHSKIVCLGHGTPGGLLNIQGGGFVIGADEAKYLKDKKLFIIWCYASSYAATHGLHGFITGNMPSDKWEAQGVGFTVDEKYMDDNITYWSKCCADHVEQALNGDAAGAAKNIVKDYLSVYGDESKWNEQELGITKFNAERTTAV